MLGLANTFDVEETGIQSTEPFHVLRLGALTSRRAQLSGTATCFRICAHRSCSAHHTWDCSEASRVLLKGDRSPSPSTRSRRWAERRQRKSSDKLWAVIAVVPSSERQSRQLPCLPMYSTTMSPGAGHFTYCATRCARRRNGCRPRSVAIDA